MASKRTKREKNKVNKARFAHAREKARREAFTLRCTFCRAPATRDSSGFLNHPAPIPLCSVCHDPVHDALSVPHENIQREIDANTNGTAHHGTASVFLPDILEKGLVPRRMSGEVYYSTSASRAEIYAKSWAVGMHAGGASDSMRGVVVSFPIHDDDDPRREQRSNFAIPRSVAPTELAVENRIDLGDLRQDTAEYIGYLRNFVGIVDWQSDAYRDGSAFADVLRCATACRDRLEKSVPNSVLRDAIHVPWAKRCHAPRGRPTRVLGTMKGARSLRTDRGASERPGLVKMRAEQGELTWLRDV